MSLSMKTPHWPNGSYPGLMTHHVLVVLSSSHVALEEPPAVLPEAPEHGLAVEP